MAEGKCQQCGSEFHGLAPCPMLGSVPPVITMSVPVPSLKERLHSLINNVASESTLCKGCAQRIVFITHRNGKKTPYDAEGETVGVNHFITCPRREMLKRV